MKLDRQGRAGECRDRVTYSTSAALSSSVAAAPISSPLYRTSKLSRLIMLCNDSIKHESNRSYR